MGSGESTTIVPADWRDVTGTFSTAFTVDVTVFGFACDAFKER